MLRQFKVSFSSLLKLKSPAYLPLHRFSSTSSNDVLEPLTNRTLLRVSGSDVRDYLQGLITNDVEHLDSGPGSMYTMFLNTAGRLLYDSIIYRNLENNTFLLECDGKISDALQKYMKMYRVRRKIDITNVGDEFKVYTLFNIKEDVDSDEFKVSDGPVLCQELRLQPPGLFRTHRDLLIYRDPRIAALGCRIIARSDVDVKQQLGDIVSIRENKTERNYRWLRYSLGVGEGTEDLPPKECFPLECNCDYLHGVSFHKGCYIGQELTARVHHTGVVRKRLMPIFFTKVPSKFPEDKIVHESVNLGKLRGIEKDVGLASLRTAKALVFKEIKLGDGIFVTAKPNWWPSEAPKDRANISELQ